MEKLTTIMSAFPGTGKTTLFNATESLRKNGLDNIPIILDSDSSKFSWLEPGVRNPNFPNNYIEHIRENIGKVDLIMVSTHKIVRDALRAASIHFILVYPLDWLKNEYMERYVMRNSPDAFIKLMNEKWDNFLSELKNEGGDRIILGPKQFIADVIITENSTINKSLWLGKLVVEEDKNERQDAI